MMLTSNDFLAQLVARQRRDQLLEEARVHRLLAASRAGRPSWRRRLMAGSGDVLILVGGRLKGGYDPAVDRRLVLDQPCAGEM